MVRTADVDFGRTRSFADDFAATVMIEVTAAADDHPLMVVVETARRRAFAIDADRDISFSDYHFARGIRYIIIAVDIGDIYFWGDIDIYFWGDIDLRREVDQRGSRKIILSDGVDFFSGDKFFIDIGQSLDGVAQFDLIFIFAKV